MVPLRFSVVVVVCVLPPQAAISVATRATIATPARLLHCFQVTNGSSSLGTEIAGNGPRNSPSLSQRGRQLKRFSRIYSHPQSLSRFDLAPSHMANVALKIDTGKGCAGFESLMSLRRRGSPRQPSHLRSTNLK